MKEHRYKRNGKFVTREEFFRGGKIGGDGIPMFAGTAYTTANPLKSEALGRVKSMIPELREEIRDIPGAEVNDKGQVEFTSRSARTEMLRRYKLHDNDGGYGDG